MTHEGRLTCPRHLEVDAFLARGDFHLRTKHAQRAGIDPHHRQPSSAAPLGPRAPARSAGARRRAPLALVWIGIRAVLDEHRSREQIVGLAEYVGEIARVGVGYRGGLVAVDHDARRVAAALVRVTQLDAPAATRRAS